MKEAEVKLGIGQQRITEETFKKLQVKALNDELLCEFGSPRLVSTSSQQQRADRYRMVLPDRICAKITTLRREEDGTVYGTVVPHGPHAQPVKTRIERGQAEELAFSARIVTKASVADVITYDLVKF